MTHARPAALATAVAAALACWGTAPTPPETPEDGQSAALDGGDTPDAGEPPGYCLPGHATCTSHSECCSNLCQDADGGGQQCYGPHLTSTLGEPCSATSDCVAGLVCEISGGETRGTCQVP